MKAFFDTSVYINTFFRKVLTKKEFTAYFDLFEIVICPIVKHELLLGTIHQHTREQLEKFFDKCPIISPPSNAQWDEVTTVMRKLNWKENRQQNDVLIALLAKDEPATVITYDKHFQPIKKHVDFELIVLEEKK